MVVIKTDRAPAAIGPYSQAIVANGMVYTSGQIPIDPATGNLVEGIEAQTRQVFANLSAVLEAAGSELAKVVKATVFLQSMQDFAVMNSIYAGYFHDAPPARSAVEVAALPRGSLIEIEVVALLK